jgi:hypothetical protein
MSSNQLHPIHHVYDGKFNTFTNKLIDINALTPDMFCLEDMAKGLSNICRFGGQIHSFYSVAKHTMLVWFLAPDHLKRAALGHDLAEAYVNDVIKPQKVFLGDRYAELESMFEAVIFRKYRIPHNEVAAIKPYDMLALEYEHTYFKSGDKRFVKAFTTINNMVGCDTAYRQLLKLLRYEFGQFE